MLIKNEDSINNLYDFTCNSRSSISLFHFLNLEDDKLCNEVNNDESKKENDIILHNENEKKKQNIEECTEKSGDKSKNFMLSFKENIEKGNVDNLHSNEHILKKGKDIMNSNENVKNILDLIYHESYNLIYKDTNIHIEIPSILNDIDDDNNSNDYNSNNNSSTNIVGKIEYLKDYLNNNLKHMIVKNKEIFLKNINVIREILNCNFLFIYKNLHNSDLNCSQKHDNFIIHILKMKKELETIKPIEEKSANDETTNIEKNCNPSEQDVFYFNTNIEEKHLNCDNLRKMELSKDKQKTGDEIKVHNNYSKENNISEKNILKECNEQDKTKCKNFYCIYEGIKNITCVFKPGINYKYVYPPNHKLDNIKEWYVPKSNILFNSKFESGNLQYAMKEKNKEIYSLFLNHDIRMNEKKNQWFYFSASYVPDEYYNEELDKKKGKQRNMNEFLNEINKDIYMDCDNIKYSVDSSDKFSVSKVKKLEKPFTVRFKIANMSKPYFLYKEGYSPLVFSECKNKLEKSNWERCAYDVKYIKNTTAKYFNIKKNCFENLSYNTYSLEFSYDFNYSYDTVYFCSSYPYTYSYLTQYLNYIKNYVKNNKTINYIEQTLCKTTCGFNCPIIAITNYDTVNISGEDKLKENQKDSEEISDDNLVNEKCDKKVEEKNNCNNESPLNTNKSINCISNSENINAEKGDNFQNDEYLFRDPSINLKNRENEKDDKGTTLINKGQCFSLNNDPNIKKEELYNSSRFDESNSGIKMNHIYTKENKEVGHDTIDDNRNNNDQLFLFNLLYNINENSSCMNDNGNKNVNTNKKSNCVDIFLNRILSQNKISKSSDTFMNEFPSLLKRDIIYETKKNKTKEPLNSNGIVSIQKKEKNIIFLTARIHPGETNASYAMHGFISFIISNNIYANILRDNFIFIIIPMLNIDGVVLGYNRYCSNGFDLNRQWNKPIFYLHPTIYSAKSLIKKINKNNKVAFFCDFHGHSRKYNCFLYGNSDTSTYLNNKKISEIFPEIFADSLPLFSLKDTKFKVENENRGIARYICGYEFNIDCSYTFEISLIGVKVKKDFRFISNINRDYLLTKDNEISKVQENKRTIQNSSEIYGINRKTKNEKTIEKNWETFEVNEKLDNNLFEKCANNCSIETKEKEKNVKRKINYSTKENITKYNKRNITDDNNNNTNPLNESDKRKNSKELKNVSKIENKGNIVENDYDPNVYDFFYYDENMLLITGISFGISLFKFMNFSAYYEPFLHKIVYENKLSKCASLTRNLKDTTNSDKLEGLNASKYNNSNGLKKTNLKKKTKLKKKDFDNSLNFNDTKNSKVNLHKVSTNNINNDTKQLNKYNEEEREKKKVINNENKPYNNNLINTLEKRIIASNNFNNHSSNASCNNNNSNGNMLAGNNSSSAGKIMRKSPSNLKREKKTKPKKTSSEGKKEYLKDDFKNTKNNLKEKEVNTLNIINKKKDEKKLSNMRIRNYVNRHTIHSCTKNYANKYISKKNINSTYYIQDNEELQSSTRNKASVSLNPNSAFRGNKNESYREHLFADSFLCISDKSNNNDINKSNNNHNKKNNENSHDNKKDSKYNEQMNYKILLRDNEVSENKIQFNKSKKCIFMNKERKNNMSTSVTIKSKKYRKEKGSYQEKSIEKKKAVFSDSYLDTLKAKNATMLREHIYNKESYIDNGNKKIKGSIKLSRTKKINNAVYTEDSIQTKKKENELEYKYKHFTKGNNNIKENKLKNNLKICKSVGIIKIINTRNMESEINCYSFPVVKDTDKNTHIKKKKNIKKKNLPNTRVSPLIMKLKNCLKSKKLFYDNKYFKILNLKKEVEKRYDKTVIMHHKKNILNKLPLKIEASSKIGNITIKEKKKKKKKKKSIKIF